MAMIFCLYGIFKSNLCLPRCFFAAFIFFGFLLLPSKFSGIVMPPLEVASTLQDHCLPQTTVTEPNFIQKIFSTLSNLKISSNFHLEFEKGCQRYISLLAQAQAVKDILAHQHRLKPNSILCASQISYLYQKSISLGFSILYIPMLWFIITQVLYYTLI